MSIKKATWVLISASVLIGIVVGYLAVDFSGIPLMLFSGLTWLLLMFGYSKKHPTLNRLGLAGVVIVVMAWTGFLMFKS